MLGAASPAPSFASGALTGAALLLALYLVWLLSRLRRYRTLNKIPCQLPGSWLASNAWDLASLPKVRHADRPDTQSLFKAHAKQALASGHGLFRIALFRYIPLLNREWVVIADWELAKELLAPSSYGKFDKGSMYRIANPLIGHGILAQPDGVEWKQTRRMANPGFHPRMLRLAVAVAVETTAAMCERWDRGPGGSSFQCNIPDEMLRLTIDVLGRTAFSFDFRSVTHVAAADSALFSSFDIILKSLSGSTRPSAVIAKLKAKVLPHCLLSKEYLEVRNNNKCPAFLDEKLNPSEIDPTILVVLVIGNLIESSNVCETGCEAVQACHGASGRPG
jgi:hypothetical protein